MSISDIADNLRKPGRREYTGAWLYLAFFALLPFGRSYTAPALVLAVVGLVYLVKGREPEQRARILLLAGLLYLPAMASELLAVDVTKALQGLWPFLLYPLLGMGVLAVLRDGTGFRRVFQGVALLTFLLLLDGTWQGLFGVGLAGVPFGVGVERAGSVFSSPAKYGYYVAHLGVFSVLALLFMRVRVVVFLGFVVMASLGVWFGGSRSGWLIFYPVALVATAFCLWRWRARPEAKILLVTVMVAAVSVAVSLGSGKIRERLDSTVSDALSADEMAKAVGPRGEIWRASLGVIGSRPLLGNGVSGFKREYTGHWREGDVYRASGVVPNYSHQVVLEFLVVSGVIGLAGFGLAWALLIRAWRRQPDGEIRKIAAVPLVTLALLWLPVSTHREFFSSEMSLVTWMLMAAGLAALRLVPGQHLARVSAQ